MEEGRYELAELFDTVLDLCRLVNIRLIFVLKSKVLILYLVEDLLAVPEVEGVETLVEVMSR